MNITLEIKAPELVKAIEAVAEALKGSPLNALNTIDGQVTASETVQAQIQPAPVQQQAPSVVPTAQTEPQVQQAPVQQAPVQQPAPQAVPTSAPTYSMDQLAVAATQLVDAGKRDNPVQLLQSFGAQALTQLPKEQYGAFATKLREMGAKI
jgi:hypothetical protein